MAFKPSTLDICGIRSSKAVRMALSVDGLAINIEISSWKKGLICFDEASLCFMEYTHWAPLFLVLVTPK